MEYNRRFSKFPRVIVFCKRTQDVINAVKWARERGVRLRARSGRHSYEGFSTVNGGMIIDVSEMNKAKVDRKTMVAHVQTGNPLARVYRKLWNQRVTIPAGTAPDVGIAGLTLGGGIGLLSRKYGLTCDNLKQVKMVVASGRHGAKTIIANNKKHLDLLWASRGGGGGNFGIATAFTFRVRPIRTVSIYKHYLEMARSGEGIPGLAALGTFGHEPLNLNHRGGCQAGGNDRVHRVIVGRSRGAAAIDPTFAASWNSGEGDGADRTFYRGN